MSDTNARPALPRLAWTAAKAVYSAAPLHSLAVLTLTVVNVARGVATMVLTSATVGAVPGAVSGGPGSDAFRHFFTVLVAAVVLWILGGVLGSMSGVVQQGLSSKYRQWVQRRIMDGTLGPRGIAHLEDPAFMDEVLIARGNNWTAQPEFLVQGLDYLVLTRLTGLSSFAILFGLAWWIPPMAAVGLALQYRWFSKEIDNIYVPLDRSSPELRRSQYYQDVAMRPGMAKEMRVFGLQNWIVDRAHTRWRAAMTDLWRSRRKLRGEMIRTVVLLGGMYVVMFVVMGRAAVTGQVSLTALALYAQAALSLSDVASVDDALVMLRNSARALTHSLGLRTKAARAEITGARTDVDGLPAEEVRVEGLRFHYPGTDRALYDGLDLRIRAGTSLAIVGDNGAGKTTLVKLLARMYDPDDGRITVDGVDLRELEPGAWRRRVAVIFQDFVRYELAARDNVGFGNLPFVNDDDELRRAARVSGIEELVDGLPKGWDTVLSKGFTGGTDLSGGQWQRIALARAVIAARAGGLLILDEPTANLDVRAEAELFDRFLDVTQGVTTVLISHRFSTVRHADRIVVLDGGRVVEEGSHDELVAANGRYARSFRLQAQRFQEEDERVGD